MRAVRRAGATQPPAVGLRHVGTRRPRHVQAVLPRDGEGQAHQGRRLQHEERVSFDVILFLHDPCDVISLHGPRDFIPSPVGPHDVVILSVSRFA